MAVFCQMLGMFLLSRYVLSMTNLTEVTVSGSVGNIEYEFGIINGSANWFQASNYCVMAGYKQLASTQPYRIKLKSLTEFLRSNSHPSPATFWMGHFRPYPQILNWYHSENCFRSRKLDSNLNVSFNDGQCAAVYYQTTSGYDYPTFLAKDCELELPFICYKSFSPKSIVYYEGYMANGHAPNVRNWTQSNITKELCEDIFTNNSNSPLYSYNHTSEECLIWDIDNGFGTVEFNLTFVGANITQGMKEGNYTIQYKELDANHSIIPVGSVFPDCNISPIPDGYCICGIPDEDFDQMLQDLTVDSSSTFKAKQKLLSAEDNRTSSKFLGSVGLIIIIMVISLIGIADLSTLLLKCGVLRNKTKHQNQSIELRDK